MNLEELTVKQVRELQSVLQPKTTTNFPYKVGDNVFIRTVTLYYTGKISQVKGQWITLEDAAWIADTGRFHDFLKTGKCNEYEGFILPVSIPMGSIIDITEWSFPLFREQK
jgi:hypothetical protein